MVTTRAREYNEWIVLQSTNKNKNVVLHRSFFCNEILDYLRLSGIVSLVPEGFSNLARSLSKPSTVPQSYVIVW